MRHAILLSEVIRTPWAMMPDQLAVLASVLVRWAADRPAAPEVMAAVQADAAAVAARRGSASAMTAGGIAVLPFYGIVTQRQTAQDVSGPGTVSTQAFGAALRAAVADDTVSGIVIDIDSPGGSVFGVPELADAMRAARAQKPVYAVANSLAASAAYWVASQASQVYMSPAAQVGSIGVYAAHEDVSRALEAAGVKVTLVSAGKYKTEASPYEPLSTDARAHMQEQIEQYYGMFTRDVAAGRGVTVAQVREGMGEGRALVAGPAKAAGMVDGVATLDQVVAKMQRDVRAARGPGARAAARARDLDVYGG